MKKVIDKIFEMVEEVQDEAAAELQQRIDYFIHLTGRPPERHRINEMKNKIRKGDPWKKHSQK